MNLESLCTHLINTFPSRNQEIRQILSLLGEPSDPLLPLFIYGGASTGKTSILLETFKQMKRPFAYTSCRSSHSPRILFESILNQLYGHVRTSENGFCSVKKCDKLGDFLNFLPDACLAAIASAESRHGLGKKVWTLPHLNTLKKSLYTKSNQTLDMCLVNNFVRHQFRPTNELEVTLHVRFTVIKYLNL